MMTSCFMNERPHCLYSDWLTGDWCVTACPSFKVPLQSHFKYSAVVNILFNVVSLINT